jgi:hypothetical protein
VKSVTSRSDQRLIEPERIVKEALRDAAQDEDHVRREERLVPRPHVPPRVPCGQSPDDLIDPPACVAEELPLDDRGLLTEILDARLDGPSCFQL